MNLTLLRNRFNNTTTLGELTIDGQAFKCFTLEDKDRDLYQQAPVADIVRRKVMSETCIPYGHYEIAITYSARFAKLMPEILNVPGFTGVRIHTGNTAADTDGCLLVGDNIFSDDRITESKVAFARLYPLLQEACAKEKVYITIIKDKVA
jgi:hypothetical protein